MSAGVDHLALLRGINVGGKNLIRMADLRDAFEELGFDDVTTYIQTGNVLFRAPRQRSADLAARIERALTRHFDVELKIVLLNRRQLGRVVADAPPDFGAASDRCDAIFLRSPLIAERAFRLFEMREGIDRAWPGPGVVYYARLAERASGSRLSNIVMVPEYKEMTIRSWGTVRKLETLMASREG